MMLPECYYPIHLSSYWCCWCCSNCTLATCVMPIKGKVLLRSDLRPCNTVRVLASPLLVLIDPRLQDSTRTPRRSLLRCQSTHPFPDQQATPPHGHSYRLFLIQLKKRLPLRERVPRRGLTALRCRWLLHPILKALRLQLLTEGRKSEDFGFDSRNEKIRERKLRSQANHREASDEIIPCEPVGEASRRLSFGRSQGAVETIPMVHMW